MSRGTATVDRFVTLLVGLLLLVVGAAAALWWSGTLADLWRGAPDRLDTGSVVDATRWDWVPWAAGALGLVLVLLALRWLLAHLPGRGLGRLLLPGSGAGGRLLLDPSAAADTAADVLQEAPGVRSARARALRDRGQLVLDLAVTIEPTADLDEVVQAADHVAAQLRQVVDRDDVRARVRLSVARRARHQPRVS